MLVIARKDHRIHHRLRGARLRCFISAVLVRVKRSHLTPASHALFHTAHENLLGGTHRGLINGLS